MNALLVTPPVALIIVLAATLIFYRLCSGLAFKVKNTTNGSKKSYACGEDTYNNMAQPDYSNFFPFAFFFTIAHVAALIMTTVPKESFSIFTTAAIYVLAAIVALFILIRE
jgi:NADH:ubiquinone oxidoreductase subunit 3 (subunit A)